MKKDLDREFRKAKAEALEVLAPHLLSPGVYPMPRLSVEQCAALLAKEPGGFPSPADVAKAEQSALAKMKGALARAGIRRVADVY